MKMLEENRREMFQDMIFAQREQRWMHHNIWFHLMLQSHSNKTSLLLAQKQTGRQVE
jgi:hypothetical protein